MNKEIEIVLVLVMLVALPEITAAARSHDEISIVTPDMIQQRTIIDTYTGADADKKRAYLDMNGDGVCEREELGYYRNIEEKAYSGWSTDKYFSIFMDGSPGKIIDVECNDEGTVYRDDASVGDIVETCTYTIDWDLEDKDEHTYCRSEVDNIAFTVPEGWVISSTRNFIQCLISSDNRTFRGVGLVSTPQEIKFTKIHTQIVTQSPSPSPKEIPEETSVPKPTPAPGFEAIFAIAGLVAISYILRRCRK